MARISPLSGYTFVEILVATLIMGTVLSLGVAGIREFSRRQQLLGEARKIQSDLRLTQQMALSGEKPAGSACDSPNLLNGYSFRVNSNSYLLRAVCTGGVITKETVYLPSGFTLSIPSPNPIVFKALGQGTRIQEGESATLELTQTATGKKITITVTAGGEIK